MVVMAKKAGLMITSIGHILITFIGYSLGSAL